MGTVLSIYPTSKKEAVLDDRKEGDQAIKTGSLKKQSMLVSALTFKKMVVESTKKKSCKKVNPNASQVNNSHVNQLISENNKKTQQSSTDGKKGPLTVPVSMVTTHSLQPNQPQVPSGNVKLLAVQKQPSKVDLLSPRRVIIQASTGELLRCLGEFTCRRCYKVKLAYSEVIIWFRNVDQTLLLQGWQDETTR
ncbi:cyclin-dependent kinase 5 activator 1-like, partial [Salmo trutta]|uniref:cyclin-dependent kinase 5 activator 1-like n=1 Tax=Salmo trutta TaxID=8032 RepID=UPI00112FF141